MAKRKGIQRKCAISSKWADILWYQHAYYLAFVELFKSFDIYSYI